MLLISFQITFTSSPIYFDTYFQELKSRISKESQFWSSNVKITVAEESTRQKNREDEISEKINQISEDRLVEIRTQSEINEWLIDNISRMEAVSESY